MILKAKAGAVCMMAKAQAEIDQLKMTLDIMNKEGESGKYTYIIENFQRLIGPFAETLALFPVDNLSVITGVEDSHESISAVHPNVIDAEKNRLIDGALSQTIGIQNIAGDSSEK